MELEKTADGFEVAEMDLRERGPGQFFGTAQHGMAEVRIADLGLTLDVIQRARDEAKAMVSAVNSGKAPPEIKGLVQAIRERFDNLQEHGRSR